MSGHPSPGKVAVIGSGAVGSYYGARLAQAGHDVHFLMRRDYEAVRRGGLHVTSPEGDFVLERPNVARSSAEIGEAAWVLCALKSTSLADARELLAPCVGENTRVLLIMNGLGLEATFAEWFGPQRIFGCMAFTCINRGEPGYVHHLRYGALTIGHYLDLPQELEVAAELWQGTPVPVTTAASLLHARWEKLCWNIPFNGMTVTAGGVSTEAIVTDPGLRAAARGLMEEVVAAGNRDLEARGERARLDSDEVIGRMFALTDTMGEYSPSTLIDFLEGNPMEVESIFGAPLARAQALGVAVARLSLVTAVMRSLARNRPAAAG